MATNATRRHSVPVFIRDTLRRSPHLWLTCLAGLFVFTILTILFGGETLRPVRESLGIEWMMGARRGVYADCREAQNTTNRFCRRDYENPFNRATEAPSRFERPTKEAPFSLSQSD
jgi:hypothetical protein